ncbi:DUF2759 domain-containing protein [Aneurinibacillus tyrosinisolvens]|jgi:hypothetical protein|uniref:DUF2759 domain-containing protein n=1 Tax=Aneurinibacillus tyrosinisolvens TaxID=1443435 RepID=UPI000AEB51F6|nr:DUF2759 domain-containing protein [Aneurinibacillus tyrosinisolvens]
MLMNILMFLFTILVAIGFRNVLKKKNKFAIAWVGVSLAACLLASVLVVATGFGTP